ncbi:hypothetical protein J4232_00960 [Candidatus Woesearchaeota archaeon]|nr:hypothetical protein [Candidatus Woesearchaeota archaeon]
MHTVKVKLIVKVISLSEKAYQILKRNKKPSMSFSDIVITHMGDDIFKQKTEDIDDLINWIRLHEKGTKKKERINHDLIAYGVGR